MTNQQRLEGLTGMKCDAHFCTTEAVYRTTLTDNTGEAISYRDICETHAQEMFSRHVDFGAKMDRKISTIERDKNRRDAEKYGEGKIGRLG